MKIGSQKFGMLKSGQKKTTKLFPISKKAVPKNILGRPFFINKDFLYLSQYKKIKYVNNILVF